MKLKKISRKAWNETHNDYKMIVRDNHCTGWPVGTRAVVELDKKTGATVLVPVEIEEVTA